MLLFEVVNGYGICRPGVKRLWVTQTPPPLNQSINLLKSLRGIEVALSIRARGSFIKRMPKIKEIKLNKQ